MTPTILPFKLLGDWLIYAPDHLNRISPMFRNQYFFNYVGIGLDMYRQNIRN